MKAQDWFPGRNVLLDAIRAVRVRFPDTTLYAELTADGLMFREYGTRKWLGTLSRDETVSVSKPRRPRR